jgi:hypothetical protein
MNESGVNLMVAELLGIKAAIINNEVYSLYRDESRCDLLDYINDPVQRELLMLELLKVRWVLEYVELFANYRWVNILTGNIISNIHFGKATCLAFIEMKESKDERPHQS